MKTNLLNSIVGWMCCNEAPALDGEWVKLCDYGHYPHRLGMQDCTKTGLAEMALNFAADKTKAGKRWRGVPITMGHRLARNENLPDMGAKLGRVLDFELRDEGPFVQVAWNSKGTTNVQEGYAEFPSPEWLLKKGAKGFMQPVKLVGIGMVESPNIPTSEAWTNESPQPEPNDHKPMKLLELLRTFLALNEEADEAAITTALNDCMCGEKPEQPRTLRSLLWLPEDATAEQVQAAIATREAQANENTIAVEALKAKLAEEEGKATAANEQVTALNEQITTLNTQLETANNERTAAQATHRDALIHLAINEGRATPAEREALVTAFNEDFTAAATALQTKKPTHHTKALVLPVKDARSKQLAVNEAQEKFAALATEHAKAKSIPYQQAFNELLRDPKHGELVLAMNG
jgi:hypothetical protein